MSSIDSVDRDSFRQSFLETLLWSTTGDEDEHLDGTHSLSDFHPATIAGLHQQCDAFLDENLTDINAVIDQVPGYAFSSAGHDFALSRNGHGAGFFDCGVDGPDQRLQAAAEKAGPSEAYVGDDGLVYVGGLETFGQDVPPRPSPRP